MTRLLAWLASFREAFRLARQIQRGELRAVPLRPTARTPAFGPGDEGSTPSAAVGRYEVRLQRPNGPKTLTRTNDIAEAKRCFGLSYTVPVELYDHQLGLVRGTR